MRKVNKLDFKYPGWINITLDKLKVNHLMIAEDYEIPKWVKDKVRKEKLERSNKIRNEK